MALTKIQATQTSFTTGTETWESKFKKHINSVKDFGAVGDGTTNDYTAFVDAMDASIGQTVYVPAGTYRIGTALTLTGHFTFDEGAKIKADDSLIFNMSIEAGKSQIGEHGTGSIEWSIPHEICVEWLGVLTSNTGSVNKTNYENFLKYSNPDTYPYVVKFSRGSYPYAAPFYITSRISVEGQSMFATELKLSGTNVHGIEVCQIDSTLIETDGQMNASCVYSHFRRMEVNCSEMTFTGDIKKFMFYGAGYSSSIIEENRFDCNASYQNNMDGIFLGPTYYDAVTDTTRNRASLRNTIRNNRISNFRDGIILGRHSQSKTDREPAGGGTGNYIGGAAYENTIGPRNILMGSGTEAARPRFGIAAHYYNIDGSSAPDARKKPYANNVFGNTVFEYDGGTTDLTGTIQVSIGSTTVTGTGTKFTTELPNDLTSGISRRLAIGFDYPTSPEADKVSYMFEVASIDSDTQITLKSGDTPNINQPGLVVNKVRSGVGLFTGSQGMNNVFRDQYIDHWCYPFTLTSNAKGATFHDNHSAGGPLLHIEDNSTSDSEVSVRVHTPGFTSRTNGARDSLEELNTTYFKGHNVVYSNEFEQGDSLTIDAGTITVTQNYHRVDVKNTDTPLVIAASDVNTTSNVITKTGHGLQGNDTVTYTSNGTNWTKSSSTSIADSTELHVIDDGTLTADAFTLSETTGGSAINFDGQGNNAQTLTQTSDSLTTINGGTRGQILILHAVNGSRTVKIIDGTGNIRTASNTDFYLDGNTDTAIFIYNGSNWLELSTTDNDTAGTELTINADGAITIKPGVTYHEVDTESDSDSTDDLVTIYGGLKGQLLTLHAAHSGRTVVAKDGTGNLKLSGDFSLDNKEDTITLMYDGTNWLEIATADNGS